MNDAVKPVEGSVLILTLTAKMYRFKGRMFRMASLSLHNGEFQVTANFFKRSPVSLFSDKTWYQSSESTVKISMWLSQNVCELV